MVNLSFRADGNCVESNRWIASLSDGTTVFEDRTPNIPSAWLRLQEYIKSERLHITRLRLQAYGVLVQLPPLRDESGAIQFDGYWHSKQLTAFLDPSMPQMLAYGIGFIKGNHLHIKWIRQNGAVDDEVRGYNRATDLAGILNAEISVDHNGNDPTR